MNEELIYRDTCEIYTPTIDEYGTPTPGEPTTIPCMFVQSSEYQHSNSQDMLPGTAKLALPADNQFIIDHAYRLEEMIVQVNPFGDTGAAQTFRIMRVTPARDLLLFDQVHHVECELKGIETAAYVS